MKLNYQHLEMQFIFARFIIIIIIIIIIIVVVVDVSFSRDDMTCKRFRQRRLRSHFVDALSDLSLRCIAKTRLYDFDLPKPHFI